MPLHRTRRVNERVVDGIKVERVGGRPRTSNEQPPRERATRRKHVRTHTRACALLWHQPASTAQDRSVTKQGHVKRFEGFQRASDSHSVLRGNEKEGQSNHVFFCHVFFRNSKSHAMQKGLRGLIVFLSYRVLSHLALLSRVTQIIRVNF